MFWSIYMKMILCTGRAAYIRPPTVIYSACHSLTWNWPYTPHSHWDCLTWLDKSFNWRKAGLYNFSFTTITWKQTSFSTIYKFHHHEMDEWIDVILYFSAKLDNCLSVCSFTHPLSVPPLPIKYKLCNKSHLVKASWQSKSAWQVIGIFVLSVMLLARTGLKTFKKKKKKEKSNWA